MAEKPNDINDNKANIEKVLPDIYIMSKHKTLPNELKKYLPLGVNLVIIPTGDLKFSDFCEIQIPKESIKILKNAEVVVIDRQCLAPLLYELHNASWVQATLTGVDVILDKLQTSKPLPEFTLTRYVETYSKDQMANYVVAQIINIERNFYVYHDLQKTAQWKEHIALPNFRVLRDLTVGLLGCGIIGSAVGKLLKSCGARVIALVRKHRESSSESYDKVVTDLDLILNECDYICNVLPSTEKTTGLLDNDVLQNCKKKPVFINIGRGNIIKNSNIVSALKNGWISRAILDVVEYEPLPKASPLWCMPEVHITPHVGAWPRVEGIAKFAAENYMRYLNKEPLMAAVDWKNGY